MIPKDSNHHEHDVKHGCTPTSARCVIWNGPDIPCINLCKGDSIEEVVYQLATLLCQVAEGVIDITTLDFKCLVEENASEPTQLIAILQLLIDKHCALQAQVDGGSGGGGGVTPPSAPIPLPECLYYQDADGDQVTALLPAAYSQYLATKICEILTVIAGLTANYTSLNNRVETIEEFLANLNTDGVVPNIVSKCITAATEGEDVLITEAVMALEDFLCQLSPLLGSFTEISTVIDTECPDLGMAPQLNNPEAQMSDLGGWTADPSNLSQNLVNLWLTLCDMRAAVSILTGGSAPLPCALVSPYQVQITNKTTNSFKVSWNAPAIAGTEAVDGYNITAYEWNGTNTVGLPLFTASVAGNVLEYTYTGVISEETLYIVKVTAAYSCGESEPATIVDQLRLTSLKYKATVSDVLQDSNTTLNCLSAGHLAVLRTTKVKLTDLFTNAFAVNTGLPIQVTVRYAVSNPDCADIPPTSEDAVITILTGQSEGSFSYYSQAPVICGDACVPQYRTFTCVVGISGSSAVLAPGTSTC